MGPDNASLASRTAPPVAARTAGGIEDNVASLSHAECINNVNDVFMRVELAELMPLLRSDQTLK